MIRGRDTNTAIVLFHNLFQLPYMDKSEVLTADYFSPSDGLIEVCGLYSSLHVGRLQVALADPCRLGQARTVRVSHVIMIPILSRDRG